MSATGKKRNFAMKIRFERKDMLPKLRLAKSVTNPKGYMPILENVKIVADTCNGAVLYATDTEQSVRIRVDCEVVHNGAALLPIKEMLNILTESKQDRLWLEVRKGKIVMWGETCGQWEFEMQCPDDFPDIETFAAESYHEIPKEELQRIIRHTVFATDQSNPSFALAGVHFEAQKASDSPHEDIITAVATDGRRLAVQTKYASRVGRPVIESEPDKHGQPHGLIVPAKNLIVVETVLKEKTCSPNIKMAFDKKRVLFHTGVVTVFSQLLEGRFPKWSAIIPSKTSMHKAVVNRQELCQALATVNSALNKQERSVDLIIKSKKLTLEGFNAMTSKAKATIPIDCRVNGRIRFEPQFLIEVTKALDTESELCVYFPGQDSSDPAMIKTTNGYDYVVMPMTVSNLKNKDDYCFPIISGV